MARQLAAKTGKGDAAKSFEYPARYHTTEEDGARRLGNRLQPGESGFDSHRPLYANEKAFDVIVEGLIRLRVRGEE